MSEEEISDAIAVQLGWFILEEKWAIVQEDGITNIHLCGHPNYARNLNAMHRAWQTLTHDQKLAYRGELAWIAARESIKRQSCWMEDIAAEFGPEAFLRVVGKWKEGA